MKNYILFDLDGTLTDPKEGITRAIQYALQKLGEPMQTTEQLLPFIGPPLAVSFAELGYDEPKIAQAITYYREYFSDKGMFENEVYDHIKTLLQDLKEAGKVLAVATSKPQAFAQPILAHFKLHTYFDVVVGSELDGRRIVKAEVIAEVLKQLHAVADDCVMIGDRKHDMIGAQENHMACIGVTYGYGSAQELQQAGATYIVDEVLQLRQYLL